MNFRIGLLISIAAITASPESVGREVSLRTFETIEMPAEAAARSPSDMQIQAFGRLFSLELAPNADLLASLPPRQRRRVVPDNLFLKGTLAGIPGSWVRLNRIDGRFSGGFFDGEELYLVDSAAALLPPEHDAAAGDATIVFRLSDLDLPIHLDDGAVAAAENPSVTAETTTYDDFAKHLREVAMMADGAMFDMPLTIVSDVRFSDRHGSNTASVVAGRINFIDGIYSNQAGVGIALWHHQILSTDGSLTSGDAPELLEQFGTFFREGDGSDIPFRGLAHLFTGRDIFIVDGEGNQQSGIVGIAYLDVLCSPAFGFGIDEDLAAETVSALVFAHEVGHNFAARHDDNPDACPADTMPGIMNSSINGSQDFSDCSLEAMDPAVAEASCLIEATSSDLVFADGFEPGSAPD